MYNKKRNEWFLFSVRHGLYLVTEKFSRIRKMFSVYLCIKFSSDEIKVSSRKLSVSIAHMQKY